MFKNRFHDSKIEQEVITPMLVSLLQKGALPAIDYGSPAF